MCVFVCVSSTCTTLHSVSSVATAYPVHSLGLDVSEQLLPPIGGHLGGDVIGLGLRSRPDLDGVLRGLLGAGGQGVVGGHLLQQGGHGGPG